VIDVDQTNHYCRVKIQGSDTHVRAYFPENWESTPQYLRPGNAVRITHPGGNKARIEVAGHGFLLPTAVPGGSVAPTPEAPGDAVLTGCSLGATDPATLAVTVAPGTFRIDEITYSLSGLLMDRPDIVMDRLDLVMDSVGASVSFDAASASYFRYDAVVVGTDGVAEVVKGSNFAAGSPIDPPAAPADHVRLGWVLIYPNMTAITESDINRLYTDPLPSLLDAVASDGDLAWGENSSTVTLTMRDQYGNPYSRGGEGYLVTLTWNIGTGNITIGGVATDETTSPLTIPIVGNSESISFARYQNDPLDGSYPRSVGEPDDQTVVWSLSEAYSGLTTAVTILLRNTAGAVMY